MPVPALFYLLCSSASVHNFNSLHCIVSDGVENGIGILFTLEKCAYTPPHPPNKKKEHLGPVS